MKINEKIRTLRIRSRLTQNQTADFLDVTPSFIADVENGTAALTADMVNRLTMALIVVGLFIGSSIVYYAGIKPVVFGIPIVGFMGYIVAFVLGCWIVLDILIKGRKRKR